jgi:hypothetical protein
LSVIANPARLMAGPVGLLVVVCVTMIALAKQVTPTPYNATLRGHAAAHDGGHAQVVCRGSRESQ